MFIVFTFDVEGSLATDCFTVKDLCTPFMCVGCVLPAVCEREPMCVVYILCCVAFWLVCVRPNFPLTCKSANRVGLTSGPLLRDWWRRSYPTIGTQDQLSIVHQPKYISPHSFVCVCVCVYMWTKYRAQYDETSFQNRKTNKKQKWRRKKKRMHGELKNKRMMKAPIEMYRRFSVSIALAHDIYIVNVHGE